MAGTDPQLIASADLNGDGRLDFVIGSSRSGARVLMNDGAGNFAAGPQLGQSSLDSVALGDMNSDRIPDVILHENSTLAEIWINDGSGAVAMLAAYPTAAGKVAVGDLNGDGRSDVVVGATVFMNSDGGSLARGVDYGSASVGLIGLLADMNGDAKLDLVVTNVAASSVGVLLNKGDGTFSPLVETPIAGTIIDLQVADLDGDGTTDVAATSTQAHCTWRVDVLRNDGAGTLTVASAYALDRQAASVALADLDGDNRVDAVVLDHDLADDNVHVLRNTGDGRFVADRTLTIGPIAAGLALTDVNGDARPDLTVLLQTYPTPPYRESYPGNIGVYLNETPGTVTTSQGYQ